MSRRRPWTSRPRRRSWISCGKFSRSAEWPSCSSRTTSGWSPRWPHDVVAMYLGRVVEQGKVDDIFHDPKHPYTKALLQSIPSIDSVPRMKLPTISGSIPHPFNRPKGCPFHPRCVSAIAGRCDAEDPLLQSLGEGRMVSCSLPMTGPATMTSSHAGSGKSVLLEVKGLKKYFPIRRGLLQKTVGHVKAVDDVTFFLNRGRHCRSSARAAAERPRRPAAFCGPSPRRPVRFSFRTTAKSWTWQPFRRAGFGRCGARCR